MSALVPASLVAKPGDAGNLTGGCILTGSSSPTDGPFACTHAGNLSRAGISDLARQMGLLLTEEAQDRFEQLLRDYATAQQDCDSIAAAHAVLEAELASEREGRAESDARVTDLEERLASVKTIADLADAWLKKTAKEKR